MKVPKQLWFCRYTNEFTHLGNMGNPVGCCWYEEGICRQTENNLKCNAHPVSLVRETV